MPPWGRMVWGRVDWCPMELESCADMEFIGLVMPG